MTELEWMKKFGSRLERLMGEYGYSQEDLAWEVGVDRTTINRYVNGRCMPTVKTVLKLSYTLDCPVEDFIDFGEPIE